MISFDDLAPDVIDGLVGAVIRGLQEAQKQAVLGGVPISRGFPGTVTTAADPNGTLMVAPDPDPNVAPPPPVSARNTYGARLDVNERVLFKTAADGSRTVSELLGGDVGSVPSVGDIRLNFSATEPGHLLLGNGASYLKASYPRLWAYIQGAPAAVKALFVDVNATTFQMANLGGRTFVVAGNGAGLTARALGAKFGDENLQSHDHQSTAAGEGVDNITRPVSDGIGFMRHLLTPFTRTGSAGTGSGGNMQPSVAVNAWIKY